MPFRISRAAIAYIVDEVCKAIVKNLGPVCLKVPSATAALPLSFFFYFRKDCLYFLRRVIENFPHLPYPILRSTRNTRKYKQRIIAMETDTCKVSLAGMCAFKNVEHGGQTTATLFDNNNNNNNLYYLHLFLQLCYNCSHLRIKEMLDDVEDDVW